MKGVSISSKYKLEYVDDPDPEILELSGFRNLESAIWGLLESGGNLILGRAQSNAQLALSQLLPPLEAEHAALAATSQAALAALDADLKSQEDRGKELTTGAQEWMAELNRSGRKLSTQMHAHWDDSLSAIQSLIAELLNDDKHLNSRRNG